MRSRWSILILISVLVFSCCSSSAVNRAEPSPTPYKKPIPTNAVKIDKPINVIFSTYSKDWPVGWEWVDPDEKDTPTPHDVKKGVLRVTVPGGKDLSGERRNAPRYVKGITGDFQIETRIKFLPKENYQGAGLLIYVDKNNYMLFERAYGGFGGGAEGMRIDVRENGEYRSLVTPNEIQTDSGETEMRIVRNGQVFTAHWRAVKSNEWLKAGEFVSDYPESILAGLVMCNTAEEVTATFAYIRLLPPERTGSKAEH